jgi:hypothetical protein
MKKADHGLDRRWERLHHNGWRGVVVQSHDDWCTAYAQPPGVAKPTPALQHRDFEHCQQSADQHVPAHQCACPPWREILLPPQQLR